MEKLGHKDYEVIVLPKKIKTADSAASKIKLQETIGKEIQVKVIKKYEGLNNKVCVQILKNGMDYYETSSLTVFINRNGGIPIELDGLVNILMTFSDDEFVTDNGLTIIDKKEISAYITAHSLSLRSKKRNLNPLDASLITIRDYYNLYKKYPTYDQDKLTYKNIRNIVCLYKNKLLPEPYIDAFNAIPEWKWDYYRLKDNGIILYNLVSRADKKNITMEEIKAYKKYCKDVNGKDVSDWFKEQIVLSGIKNFL
jgi:hypothetical protein